MATMKVNGFGYIKEVIFPTEAYKQLKGKNYREFISVIIVSNEGDKAGFHRMCLYKPEHIALAKSAKGSKIYFKDARLQTFTKRVWDNGEPVLDKNGNSITVQAFVLYPEDIHIEK